MSRTKPKKTGTRKTAATARRDKRLRQETFRLRLRVVFLCLMILMVMGGAFAVFLTIESRAVIAEKIYQASAEAGFSLKTVSVEGRVYADASTILNAIGIEEGQPLLAFDPDAAHKALEKLSWIKSAQVERRWPDTVYVNLVERQPLALWQKDKELSLIDEEGVVIARRNLSSFGELLIVTGDKAPEHARDLVGLLKAEPVLAEKIEAASWTGDRRWNLKTRKGAIIKLPEDDTGLAIGRLARLETEEEILGKDISQIDLRDPGRIVVRTQPGETKTYHVNFNGQKQSEGDI
ncbi:MAG: FtsQ-type POTRA domain-containing protein [Alphaproteobacteria bacterium]|nr:FtsQ-type POTRA domain-containing protein [Alphaproteobacteria bacterium]MCD8525621.1 FtsQ-type POTRA domain-containing protein [Alphaproteobacteria bacterium]MCD8569995.1 FtsQ-type POTRA domain-containing protein [Alphaproteobacteria bacterium]